MLGDECELVEGLAVDLHKEGVLGDGERERAGVFEMFKDKVVGESIHVFKRIEVLPEYFLGILGEL